jgi:tetratricopeptide (TPR) repeat protein
MRGLVEYDLGHYPASMEDYQQALTLSCSVGWRFAELYALSYLGNTCFDLGDYAEAHNYLERSLTVAQEIGDRRAEAAGLDTLGLIKTLFGEPASAAELCKRALELQSAQGNRRGQGYTLNHLGLALAAKADLEAARQAFEQALAIRCDLGQHALACDDLAGLARLALQEGQVEQAVAYGEEILQEIASHGADGIEFPVLVYLTCGRAFLAAGLAELGGQALRDGYKLLMARAEHIQDEALRRQFLENVPFNRELLQTCRV